ncbi:MAG TPA: hypothetical protein VM933_09125 [Acidimicrobiales bacterium]|nr:hypothetical protein [Acidimicrobiales bacterium]
MHLHRLRLQFDAPARLGEAAAALAALGVDIVGLDVRADDGERRVDELLVDFTMPLDLAAVEHALRTVGCVVDDLRPADLDELTARATRCLELAGVHDAALACERPPW